MHSLDVGTEELGTASHGLQDEPTIVYSPLPRSKAPATPTSMVKILKNKALGSNLIRVQTLGQSSRKSVTAHALWDDWQLQTASASTACDYETSTPELEPPQAPAIQFDTHADSCDTSQFSSFKTAVPRISVGANNTLPIQQEEATDSLMSI